MSNMSLHDTQEWESKWLFLIPHVGLKKYYENSNVSKKRLSCENEPVFSLKCL